MKIMRKMYKEPKVETIVLTVGNLMAPGGGSPVDSSMDPNPAPSRQRRTKVF